VHPITCSLLWVRCLFDQFLISDFGGKWPLKWNFRKCLRILRRDTELRCVTKFGENRPLRSCRKVLWIITPKKLRLCGTRLCPHFAQNRPKSENLATFMPRSSATVRRREKLTDLGKSLALALQRGVKSISLHASHDRSRPKFPERCHPLTCPRILNLVRIGCALPDLFRKDWFFGPKSNYNIGCQPTIIITDLYSAFRSEDTTTTTTTTVLCLIKMYDIAEHQKLTQILYTYCIFICF